MCRTPDLLGFPHGGERDPLRIQAFFLNVLSFRSCKPPSLSQSLTLAFPPRLNGAPLRIDGDDVRPDSSGFLTLHRIVSGDGLIARVAAADLGVAYGSTDVVWAGEGTRFDVYFEEDRVLAGVFRRGQAEGWGMECRCCLDGDADDAVRIISAAEVLVAVAKGRAPMSARVEMTARWGRRDRKATRLRRLEEIPEVREEGEECCGYWGWDGGESDVERRREGKMLEVEVEVEMERGESGSWFLWLGVGLLVITVASKFLRRRRLF